jgi:hypothetical protein
MALDVRFPGANRGAIDDSKILDSIRTPILNQRREFLCF